MSGLVTSLVEQARALPALEAIAVVAAIAYLVLAIRQNIWCWGFAGLSSAIYVYLLFDVRLYMESALNVFYFVMAVYGFGVWRSGGRDAPQLPVTSWPAGWHLRAIVAVLLASVVAGFLLERNTDAMFPYIDSMTTFGALWATFLVARKVIENWYYWLVIDVTLVCVFWIRELELTALLFAAYVVMIPFGLVSWRRSMAAAA
ncbi:MAG: nicotinamide riboside transporter PnuC [Woeseiaceae bacterium]|nr:nicotinamide riboside transporter PnuC [Woeseiaceae bacterium]